MRAVIRNVTRNNLVCEHTEVANTLWRRLRGLLGRSELAPGHGMLFEREASIHSAFMRFRFDAIFLDRDLRVLRLAHDIAPWRALGAKGTRNVLELSSGEISRRGVQIGDQLAVEESGSRFPGSQTPALVNAHPTTSRSGPPKLAAEPAEEARGPQ